MEYSNCGIGVLVKASEMTSAESEFTERNEEDETSLKEDSATLNKLNY